LTGIYLIFRFTKNIENIITLLQIAMYCVIVTSAKFPLAEKYMHKKRLRDKKIITLQDTVVVERIYSHMSEKL